jgi:hypothetical protein
LYVLWFFMGTSFLPEVSFYYRYRFRSEYLQVFCPAHKEVTALW